ncbi:recombinase family protein, partial [Rhodoferax sp.]|uniref:recombinase family protein n=1 Tax=Rhodoferax sp. TaxID=50421 RepID=UPI001A018B79
MKSTAKPKIVEPRAQDIAKPLRCAVYARVSVADHQSNALTSVAVQEEACRAYIKSQRHLGWVLVERAYTDDGVSGATLQRPGLRALLEDECLSRPTRHHFQLASGSEPGQGNGAIKRRRTRIRVVKLRQMSRKDKFDLASCPTSAFIRTPIKNGVSSERHHQQQQQSNQNGRQAIGHQIR